LNTKTISILEVIKGLEKYIVDTSHKTRLSAITLIKTLLERVKSLKLTHETMPLYKFFLNKMTDVVVTK